MGSSDEGKRITYQEPFPLLLGREALLEVLVQGVTHRQALVLAVGLKALHRSELHFAAFIVVLGIRDGCRHVREEVPKEGLRGHLQLEE